MALVRLGVMVGAASGSLGSTVFSRNRYGAYVRNRTKPVVPTTPYTQTAKQFLATASSAWRGLTSAQREQWANWAQQNPVPNRLGDPQVLTGQAAYCKLNVNIAIAGGSPITSPPVAAVPTSLTSLTGTFDIGAGDFEIAFTPTPLGTNNVLYTLAAVVDSAGITFVKNYYKLVDVSAANQATGYDLQASIENRFGSLQVGQVVHLLCSVLSRTTGLRSQPVPLIGTVVST